MADPNISGALFIILEKPPFALDMRHPWVAAAAFASAAAMLQSLVRPSYA